MNIGANMHGAAGDRVQSHPSQGVLPGVAEEPQPPDIESVYAPGAAGDRLRSGATQEEQIIWKKSILCSALREKYPIQEIQGALPSYFLPRGANQNMVADNNTQWLSVSDSLGKTIARHFASYPLLAALEANGPNPNSYDNLARILSKHKGLHGVASAIYGQRETACSPLYAKR